MNRIYNKSKDNNNGGGDGMMMRNNNSSSIGSHGGGVMSIGSPMQPIPPPHKKQRAVTTTNASGNVDDAISRRRAQLLRLQRERAAFNTKTNVSNTQDLLARARKQLQQIQQSSFTSPTTTTTSSPPTKVIPSPPMTDTTKVMDEKQPPKEKKIMNGSHPTNHDGTSNKMVPPPPPPPKITVDTNSNTSPSVAAKPKTSLLVSQQQQQQELDNRNKKIQDEVGPPPPQTIQISSNKSQRNNNNNNKTTNLLETSFSGDDYDDDISLLVTPSRHPQPPSQFRTTTNNNNNNNNSHQNNNDKMLPKLVAEKESSTVSQKTFKNNSCKNKREVLTNMRLGAETPLKSETNHQPITEEDNNTKRNLLNKMRQGADTPLMNKKQSQPSNTNHTNNGTTAAGSVAVPPISIPTTAYTPISQSKQSQLQTESHQEKKVEEEEEKEQSSQQKPSNMLRLVKELKNAIQEKTKALNQVHTMEKHIAQIKNQQNDIFLQCMELLQQNKQQDALQLLEKTQASTDVISTIPSPTQAAVLSPRGRSGSRINSNSRGGVAGSDTRRQRRMKSPEPTPRRHLNYNDNSTTATTTNNKENAQMQTEEVLSHHHFMMEALSMVPTEFDSEYATFIIRKPTHMDLTNKNEKRNEEEEEEWPFQPTEQVNFSYNEESNLQVMAKIKADQSILFLKNEKYAKHVFVDNDDDDITYTNIDEKPLGCITYIDAYGEEREYWLDVIYEQAIVTRDTFIAKLFSAANVLKKQHYQQKQKQSVNGTPIPDPKIMTNNNNSSVSHAQQTTTSSHINPPNGKKETYVKESIHKKAILVDACVGTEDDLPKFTSPANPQSKDSDVTSSKNDTNVEKTASTDPDEGDSGSADVLSYFISTFFILIFRTVWFCFIGLPFRIIKSVFIMIFLTVSITLFWLYLADDNGALGMGAGIDTMFQPGVY